MMHPDTEIRFIDSQIGYGVVATKFIPKGTITWVQDELDHVFTQRQVRGMKPLAKDMIDKYSFRNSKGNYVLCWDLAKYVNHSFKSNCLSTAYDFEIAIQDIQEGEELTDDYGYLNVTEAFEAKDEGTSRTVVYPDDLLNYHEDWDELLQPAFQQIKSVSQPLMDLINEENQMKVKEIISGNKTLDSILNLYYRT